MEHEKRVRFILPTDYLEPFAHHKRETEARLAVALSDSQFARMLVMQSINQLEKTR